MLDDRRIAPQPDVVDDGLDLGGDVVGARDGDAGSGNVDRRLPVAAVYQLQMGRA